VLLASVLALFLFLWIRSAVPTAGGFGLAQALVMHAGKLASPEIVYRLLINAFVPVSLMPFVMWRTTSKFFRAQPAWAVLLGLAYVGALFGNNQERLLLPAALPVYLLIATLFDEHVLPAGRYAGVLIVAFAFVSSLNCMISRYPLEHPWQSALCSLGSLAACTWIAIRCVARKPEKIVSPPALSPSGPT
jgi:hypothetical protein